MAETLFPAYPPSLTPQQLSHLQTSIKEWSISHGLAVRPPISHKQEESDPAGNLAIAAPITLFPSLFPLNCFHEALLIQTAYNELYANIAQDEEWLGSVVSEYANLKSHNSMRRGSLIQA